jgi:hypothetical protein
MADDSPAELTPRMIEWLRVASALDAPAMVEWFRLARAIDEVGDNTITDMIRFNSRQKMFEQVDRQIRARIQEVLPGMLREVQKHIDKTLDPKKLADQMNKTRAWVNDQIRSTRENFDSTVGVLVSDAVHDLDGYHVKELARQAKQAIRSVVAKEVGVQLARFLKAPAPSKKRKAGK